jgi:hypothetical protein
MKKLLLTVAVLTTFVIPAAVLSILATPAFAQSFCTCDGTGNVLKFTDNPITYQNQAPTIAAKGQNGLNAFGMAPRHGARFNSNDPATTGGGSIGYNEMLRNY